MSLIKQNQAFEKSDFLFIALGLAGIVFFFLTYSHQDPRSAVDTSLDLKSNQAVSIQQLGSLGYTPEDFTAISDLRSHRRLLDSLQYRLGRTELASKLTDSSKGIYPFFWETTFQKQGRSKESDAFSSDDGGDNQALSLHVNEKGEWFELLNPGNIFPSMRVNRSALIYAFNADSTLDLWKSLPDSSWNRILNFNLDEGYDASNLEDPDSEMKDQKPPHEYSGIEVSRLGEYYLGESGWDTVKFELTDIRVKSIRTKVAAELKYVTREPILEQDVSLRLAVLPSGSLLSLDAEYNRPPPDNNLPDTLGLVRIITLFLFGISVIILFYFRIRARVIDTKPALVVSILAGLLIPATIFLEEVEQTAFFTNTPESFELVGLALGMGFAGAFASVGFFIAFALGDSITRQHWPGKLISYDYLRQGMFFNKPVGETILRSVLLTAVLCGLWSGLLYFFPNLYFEIYEPFLHYKAAWTPAYLLLDNAWFSMIIITGIFLVVGPQVYAQTQNRWISALFMVGGIVLMGPVMQDVGPPEQQLVLFALLGAALTAIFLKWDFLTLLLTHFLFISFIRSSSGWVTPGSPDLYVFVIFCFLVLALMGVGVLFIAKGREQQSLPGYVPEYVEELAQEERIKQELQIARQVQQSFLPVRTPELKGLDIAAICQPAFETGGDYYDFIQLDDYRIALAIGDVSGKGVPAAFYMTFTKGILHSLCRETDSPAELLKKANHLFVDNARKGTFISLVYGIIDLKKKIFTFSRAGHNPILHLNARSGEINELQPTGLGLGLTRDILFDNNITEVELSLSGDDILVLYTDGVVEALDATHNFYGDERLLDILKSQKAHSSEEILSTLTQDVMEFIGTAKQHDDMTIMVIKLDDT